MFSDDEIADAYDDDVAQAHVSAFERVFNGAFTQRPYNEFTVIERSGEPVGLASPLVSEDKKHEIRRLGGLAVHALGKCHSLTPAVRARALANAIATNRARGRRTRIVRAEAAVTKARATLAAALSALESAKAK